MSLGCYFALCNCRIDRDMDRGCSPVLGWYASSSLTQLYPLQLQYLVQPLIHPERKSENDPQTILGLVSVLKGYVLTKYSCLTNLTKYLLLWYKV